MFRPNFEDKSRKLIFGPLELIRVDVRVIFRASKCQKNFKTHCRVKVPLDSLAIHQYVADLTCHRQTDHEVVGLLSPQGLRPQDADNDQQVAHHGQQDDRDENQGLEHEQICSTNYDILFNFYNSFQKVHQHQGSVTSKIK